MRKFRTREERLCGMDWRIREQREVCRGVSRGTKEEVGKSGPWNRANPCSPWTISGGPGG